MSKDIVAFVALLPAVLSAVPAFAQDAPGPAASAPSRDSEIIVTGTRRAERTASQSIAPIDVVSGAALAASSSPGIDDKLAQSIPSFDVQRLPGADGAIFQRPVSLRNLSPDETLVLVNGHRRHRSAFIDITNQGAEAIDLGQIPSSAVGRIEVLRDGASAQYGSDAIAGVINVVLDDKPGTVLSAQTSQYYKGDGFGVYLTGKSGIKLPNDGFLVVAGDYNNSNATNRSVGVRNKIGQPDLDDYHLTYNMSLPLNDSVKLYSFGSYGHTVGWSEFSFQSSQTGSDVFDRSFFQDGADAIYPTYALTSVYPNGFIPKFGSIVKDGEAVVGLSGDLASDLTFDLSGSYGRNSIDYKVRDSINASLGSLSPTSFDAGRLVASETTANADATYLLDIGLHKPVNIAFGGEFRHERYESIAGDVASYEIGPLSDLPSGSYGFPGLSPDAAGASSRDSEAAYLDVESDLTAKATLGAAARYEHYSDFGSNFSYKISGRYQLFTGLAARATYSTGFHAPTPGQQFFTKVSTQPDVTKPEPFPTELIALVSPSNSLATPYGGRPLKPETSRNVSAGLVIQPTPRLTITADYYHVLIHNRIGLTPQISLPAGAPYDAIQFLINGFGTRSDGVDVVASWNHPLWSGSASLTVAYNYNRTRIINADPVLVTNVLRTRVEDAEPNHSAIVTAGFDRGRFHALARVHYYGSFTDAVPLDQTLFGFTNQRVSPRAFTDLNVSFDLTKRTLITVGAENLFNVYPDKNTGLFQFLGYKYPLVRPYEEDGGRWFVRVTQRF